MKLQKLIVALVLSALFICIGFIVYERSKPLIEVNIEGAFNPLDTTVLLNGVKLYPSGPEGRNFVGKANIFKDTSYVIISGPFIKNQELEIAVGAFEKKQQVVVAEENTAPTIAEGFADGQKIENLKVFEGRWIVALPKHTSLDKDRVAIILYYDGFVWKDVTSSVLTSTEIVSVPDKVRSYFYELSDD